MTDLLLSERRPAHRTAAPHPALRPIPPRGPVPRPDQVAALEATTGMLETRGRVQLVMACGTGKTLIGRWLAERLHATVTVVALPSLALTAQTLREWRSVAAWPFEAVVTCSDPATADGVAERISNDGADVDEPTWAGLRAKVTTDPGPASRAMRRATRDRPVVVFSTYHSLPTVAAAAASAGVEVDLLIGDEAHNLAGSPRPGFRVALTMPARRRVFMTATQVLSDKGFGRLSMDDEALFGPVAFRLGFDTAIAEGLLADYQVLVFETGEANPVSALVAAGGHVNRVMSFHGRVAKARAFAAALDGYQLPDGRTVHAAAVAGADRASHRESTLAHLGASSDEQVTLVASARCLTEGVNLPAVDAVLFADPKHSQVDIVQAVGRALRPAPGKTRGMVLVPVTVPDGLDVDTALATGAFAHVWRVLRALRAVDPRLREDIDAATRPSSRRGTNDGSRVVLHLPSLRDLSSLHARLADLSGADWERTFLDLVDWAGEHGHARPPAGTRLGQWVARQRAAHSRRMLPTDRAARLAGLDGWVWDLADHRWLQRWSQVLALATSAGGLDLGDEAAMSRRLQVPEPRSSITTVGRWIAAQRVRARSGDLDEIHRGHLEQIPGWTWSAIAEVDERCVDLLGEYAAWKGDANPAQDYVDDDLPVGAWLKDVRRARAVGRLARPLLDELEVVAPSSGPGALKWHRAAALWLVGYEALLQYAARENTVRVPYEHVETLPDGTQVPLSQWCARQRRQHRTGQLGETPRRVLESMPGWAWEVQPAPQVLMSADDPRHGTPAGYVKGCRCTPCNEANLADNAAREARRARGQSACDWLPAAAARGHLRVLLGQKASRNALSRATGLSEKTINGLLDGTTQRILPATETAVMRVGMPEVRAAALGGTYVAAGPTWELIDDLLGRGWPASWIARELGLGQTLQIKRTQVTALNAAKVVALHERVGELRAPRRARRIPTPSLAEILSGPSTTAVTMH